jgi:hypothetical protein
MEAIGLRVQAPVMARSIAGFLTPVMAPSDMNRGFAIALN